MIDVVGDVAGEAPVVAAVLEQVHDRHRSVGEPVHEDGLQQPLGIVANPETKGEIRTQRFYSKETLPGSTGNLLGESKRPSPLSQVPVCQPWSLGEPEVRLRGGKIVQT